MKELFKPDKHSRGACPVAPSSTEGLATLTQITSVGGVELGRPAVFPLDGLVHFPSMNRNIRWGINPQPDFVAAYIDDGNHDVITNNDAFIAMSREDQHGAVSLEKSLGPMLFRPSKKQSLKCLIVFHIEPGVQ